jgi:hypothetical protein
MHVLRPFVIFPSRHIRHMKNQLLLLWLCVPLWVCGQYSSAVQAVAPGGMAFFTKWQTGLLNNNNGIQSSFGGYDAVHALLVPHEGMSSLPQGAHSFVVELVMDDRLPVQVQADLPPLGPQHSAIAIPLFPAADDNVLPELAGAMALLLKSSHNNALEHQFRVRVYVPGTRTLLAEGGFMTEASFVVDRYRAAEEVPKLRELPPLDSAAADYLRAAVARDYPHLRLVRLSCWRAWAEPSAQPGVQTCLLAFQVKDAGGRCYSGFTWLSRKVKSNGKAGRISGLPWPNLREDCNDGR